jgi:hypothetical protein
MGTAALRWDLKCRVACREHTLSLRCACTLQRAADPTTTHVPHFAYHALTPRLPTRRRLQVLVDDGLGKEGVDALVKALKAVGAEVRGSARLHGVGPWRGGRSILVAAAWRPR